VSKAAIRHENGLFRVSGELGFGTVLGLLEQSRGLFAQAGESIEIELSAVERVDSAGLALLIEWMREARRRG
jgi:phospholipid transport system transporter-binding protein